MIIYKVVSKINFKFMDNIQKSFKLPLSRLYLYIYGEMAEWSNAAVLKTVEGHTSGGSNPSFSAYKFPNVFIINVLGFLDPYLFDFVGSDIKSQKNNLKLYYYPLR